MGETLTDEQITYLVDGNARLRKALRPFADYASWLDAERINWPDACPLAVYPAVKEFTEPRPTVGDCRRARAAIDAAKEVHNAAD